MKILIITFLTLALTGCTTLSDARLAKGTGMTRSYSASFDKTWAGAMCSVNALGLPIAAENKSEGYILAQRGISAFSYGENVAVFVRKESSRQTSVEVISKKALQTTIFAPNWEPKILDGINGCLAQ